MTTPFDNVDPNDLAATHATRTELELRQLEARRAELLAKKQEEDAAKASYGPALRGLASGLHSVLCPNDHPTLRCTWYLEGINPDSPVTGDWTGTAHDRWLGIAAGGVMLLRATGWTVEEP